MNEKIAVPYDIVMGIALRLLRKSSGKTQAELAEVLGINTAGWSRIESGKSKISMANLKTAAKQLRVKPSYILNECDDLISILINQDVFVIDTKVSGNWKIIRCHKTVWVMYLMGKVASGQ